MIFYIRWPLVDWQSPLGYIVPWYLQAAGLYCICHVSANNFVYDTGLCATMLNYISDIKRMIGTLNEAGKANGSKMDVHKNISRFLRCHVKAKELSEFKIITNTNHIIRIFSGSSINLRTLMNSILSCVFCGVWQRFLLLSCWSKWK